MRHVLAAAARAAQPQLSPLPGHSHRTRAAGVHPSWRQSRKDGPVLARLLCSAAGSAERAQPLASAHLLQAAPTRLLDELLGVHLLPNVIAHVDSRLLEELARRRQGRVRARGRAGPGRAGSLQPAPGLGAPSAATTGGGRAWPAALTFMYLPKTARISSLMLGCSTARSSSMDTAGSVKLQAEGSAGAQRPGLV